MKKSLIVGLAALVFTTPAAAEQDQTKQIESVVKNLLEREPLIIENALRKGMEARQKAAQEQASTLINSKKDELYNNKMDPFIGNPNGSIKMVVFMDPYCGFCRRFKSTLTEVVKEQPELKVIYKTYPIIHAESRLATEEELAANQQGKFVEFQEKLYASKAQSREERLAFAKELKLDMDKFNKGMTSSEVEAHIDATLALGQELDINGTPAFIIGNELHAGFVDKATVLEMLKNNG